MGWIAVNLANGPNEVVFSLLYDKYDDSDEPNVPSESFLDFLKKGILSSVPARRFNALWFTANACGESKVAADLILNRIGFNFFEALYNIMDN